LIHENFHTKHSMFTAPDVYMHTSLSSTLRAYSQQNSITSDQFNTSIRRRRKEEEKRALNAYRIRQPERGSGKTRDREWDVEKQREKQTDIRRRERVLIYTTTRIKHRHKHHGVAYNFCIKTVTRCRSDLVPCGCRRDNGEGVTQCCPDLVPCGYCTDLVQRGCCRDNGKSGTQCCTDLVYYGCCRDTVRVLHSVVLTWFITAVVVTS